MSSKHSMWCTSIAARALAWAPGFSIVIFGTWIAVAGPLEMTINGPLSWNTKQPAAWQGAVELAIIGGLVFAAAYYLRRLLAFVTIIFLSEIYARRHGFDIDLILSLLYVEGIVACGVLVIRCAHRPLRHTESLPIIYAVVLGILIWSVLLWTSSVLGFGSAPDLRTLSLVILPLSLLSLRRVPLIAHALTGLSTRSLFHSALAAFIVLAVLMLFAKARVSVNYDSLWYGLRGDRVLVGAGSVFKNQGLVAPVHYYPKAYELLLIPLSGIGSVTLILGFSVWMWAICGIVVREICSESGMSWPVTTMCVAATLSVPALMNVAITTKGGLAAAVMTLFACYTMMRYRRSNDPLHLWVAVSALLVAPLFRLSVAPYVAVLGLMWIWWAADARIRTNRDTCASNSGTLLSACFVVLAVIMFVLVQARTQVVAGVPIISPFGAVKLFEKFGFVRHYPVGLPPNWSGAHDGHSLGTLFDFVFKPSRLPHVLIYWTGSVWLAALLLGFATWKSKKTSLEGQLPLIVVAFVFPLIVVFKHFGVPGGDGNYYIVPVVCLCLLGFWFSSPTLDSRSVSGRCARLVVTVYILVGTAVSLVSGSWGPGTLKWDTKFNRPAFDQAIRTKHRLAPIGLLPIYKYLETKPKSTRVVGLLPGQVGSWLPVRYESLAIISWAKRPVVASEEAITSFLHRDEIRYVLIPRSIKQVKNPIVAKRTLEAMRTMRAKGLGRVVVATDHFELWAVSQAKSDY